MVGAGISGLSAALEAARGGANVLVIDMWSVFGGHAVMSEGGLSIPGSPLQANRGIVDSPEIAFQDFIGWGEDPDTTWVRAYVTGARREVWDWVTALGVRFDTVSLSPGNSAARFHRTQGRGLALVTPIYLAALQQPGISFVWNVKVDGLLLDRGRVVGVHGNDLRSGARREFRGRAVVVATGGFQSNLDLVREYWPRNLRFPERILAGAGINAMGSGLEIARQAGASIERLDHQWNYATGLVDPRQPGGWRGLNGRNPYSIWLNAEGRRFVNENAGQRDALAALLAQTPITYWAVFDDAARRDFWISGSDWTQFEAIERLVLHDTALVKTAPTLDSLARLTGIPIVALRKSVDRYNELVERGEDLDFRRFNAQSAYRPRKLITPPFRAARFYPLTRKSMGGIQIDRATHVMGKGGKPIPGLYAVGEATGLAGINGKAGLEGTFLGPSIFIGRVAGQSIIAELNIRSTTQATVDSKRRVSTAAQTETAAPTPNASARAQCVTCHDLARQVTFARPGYTHFAASHRAVQDHSLDCARCHSEMVPYRRESHRINRQNQTRTCVLCHGGSEP